MNKIMRYTTYGFIGLTVEVVYTGLGSLIAGDFSMHGYTFLVMFPIYGLAILLEPVHDRLRSFPWWTRGIVYLTLIWAIEYASALILTVLLGTCPWNYQDPLNINGYITLRMAPEWFAAGLFFEKLRNLLDDLQLY